MLTVPICATSDTSDFITSNGFRIVKCNQCGLLYVNPRPRKEQVHQHYQYEYIMDAPRVERDFISLREPSLKREAEYIKHIFLNGGRLLDIGAASGCFLSKFLDIPNWEVEGVEPSEFALLYARKRYGLKMHSGFLRDQTFEDGVFDVVTCLDTWSFISEPNKELETIRRILKPNGIFACEIPGLNFRLVKNTGPVSRLLYGVKARLNPKEHLYYYNRQTLSLLASRHSFQFLRSFAEQSPVYGVWPLRAINSIYYNLTKAMYRISPKYLNLVPKEFIIFQKK